MNTIRKQNIELEYKFRCLTYTQWIMQHTVKLHTQLRKPSFSIYI